MHAALVEGPLLGRDLDGCFAEYVAVDETCLHPLPGDLPAADAALLQVLSTCVHAQSCLPAFPGDSAVVAGLGVSGLLHLQLLRERGVSTIVCITRSEWKREMALRLGATAVATPEDAEGTVHEVTAGRGAGIAVECVGTQHRLVQAMKAAGAGATARRLELAPLVTGRFPLAEAERALAACDDPAQLKVMLEVG